MKKISKIIMFIMLTTVIIFLSSMLITAGSWTISSNWDGDRYHVYTNGDVYLDKAGETMIQKQDYVPVGWEIYNGIDLAQSFQVPMDCILTKVALYCQPTVIGGKPGGTTKVTIYLKADSGNTPGSTLRSKTITVTSKKWWDVDFADINLARNTRYWIFVYAQYSQGLFLWAPSGDPYPNGNLWGGGGIGIWADRDLCFKVYGRYNYTSGHWTSPSNDTTDSDKVWGRLIWLTSLNDQTLRFWIATNNDNATWSFRGPDGSTSSYYTNSGQKIWSGHDGDRYIKVRAYFWGTVDKTPVLHSFTVNYNCRPTIPVLSSPTDSSTLDDSTPTLTWINSIDKDGDTLTYKILVDNNYDFFSPEAVGSNIIEGPSTTTYISPALVDDTYHWKVCANDGALNSDWSAPWSFTLDTKSPEVVSIYPPDDGQLVAEEVDHITVDFSEDIDETTITLESICLSDEYGTSILLQEKVIYASSITLSVPQLEYCREYNIFISRNIKDTIGHSLVRDYNFSFITLIPGGLTESVPVEHKTGKVMIKDPSTTFPGGSKGYYINLVEKDIQLPSNYVKETGRILKCYSVDYSGNPKDIDWLKRPVTISIPCLPDTKDKKNLKLYFYNKEINRWELVRGSECRNLDDDDYYVTGEVRITNTEYCVRGFVMGGLIEEYSNYPNPFKAGKEYTTIRYVLEKNAKVTISIYDLLGQLVRRIEIPEGTPEKGVQGTNKVPWNGRNERGRVVANGGYYCVVEADTETGKHMKKARKIMVIK